MSDLTVQISLLNSKLLNLDTSYQQDVGLMMAKQCLKTNLCWLWQDMTYSNLVLEFAYFFAKHFYSIWLHYLIS